MNAEELVLVNGGGVVMQGNNQQEEDERNKKKIKKEHEEKTEEEIVNIDNKYIVDDIVTQILDKIPVESLFNSFRYVCKSWFNIISTHPSIHLYRLIHSKHPFLIIQSMDNTSNSISANEEDEQEEEEEDYTYTTSFIKMGKQGIEEQFDLTSVFKKLRIRACCNGLILATPSGLNNIKTLYVVNPLTNHQVKLPPRPLDSDLRFAQDSYSDTIKFIFNPSTKEYQVIVGGFRPGTGLIQMMQSESYIQMLTLSADDCCASSNDDGHLSHREWRIIQVPERIFMRQSKTRGFFIWGWGRDNRITFDVDTEKFYDISHPIYHRPRVTSFMEMGGFLTSWSLETGLVNEHDDFWTLSVNI